MIGLISQISVALALFSFSSASVLPRQPSKNPKALYFMTNDGKNNAIVSLPVAANGLVSDGKFFPTGGFGGIETNLSSKLPVTSDALSSQGTVAVHRNNLFAINAGSNTLSMFSINPRDPTELTLLGEPVSTNGEFPVSVAVSGRNKLVCVANTGAVSGVSCTTYDSKTGLKPMDSLRNFYLDQSTPAVGPFDDVGSILFSEEESRLLTTVKRNRTEPTGYLSVFSVENGKVGTINTKNFINGTSRLFGAVTIPGTNNIFAADPGVGSVILNLHRDNTASLIATTNVTDQATTCWAEVSPKTGTGFLSDNCRNHIVEVDLKTGAIVSDYFPPNNNLGMTELAAAGDWLYALSPGRADSAASVVVFDISGGRGTLNQIQNFTPKNSPFLTAEGMVSWP